MPLRPPNLDDRDFNDLVEEAKRRITQSCPEWTDLSAGDPGMVLLELFAHLTETLTFRLNRLPEKAYVEFLRLIGVKLKPPSGAIASLRFSLSRPQDRSVEIPCGTRVTAARGSAGNEPPVFTTVKAITIEPGATAAEVKAVHCDLIEAELAGLGTGQPGLSVIAKHPPMIVRMGYDRDLVVGVEAGPDEDGLDDSAIHYEGKAYRIWREKGDFTNLGSDQDVYMVDRMTGTITFAPALQMSVTSSELEDIPRALANIPGNGREIRLWYRSGGGPQGNVTANLLTVLKDSIPGVSVTNPLPATGGRAAEELANALVRGPQELHSLQRAVTARDLELVAIGTSGSVDRAHAFTKAMLWEYATPGTAEVLLVPHVPEEFRGDGLVTVGMLQNHQTEDARERIQRNLDARRPLGTTCIVGWAKYKTVRVTARIVVNREEEPAAVKSRLARKLYQAINPLSTSSENPGWIFGQALTAWHVYKIAGSEPGVRSISQVRLNVEAVPGENVSALAADAFQPHTWYSGAGDNLFRTLNDGQGWEAITRFPEEKIAVVRPYPREASTRPDRAGLVAVATTSRVEDEGSGVYFSRDCGETWGLGGRTEFRINDMAWIEREGIPALLLATEKGFFSLALQPGATPVQIVVDKDRKTLGFYAVAVSTDIWGGISVAVAARDNAGVYLSSDGGRPESFVSIGLKNELVRILAVQHRGPHRYLWAGIAAIGDERGKGCFRWRLTGTDETPEDWQGYQTDWQAGGCRSLAFIDSTVYAASLRRGVLKLDVDARDPKWKSPNVDCGLPLRDVGRLQPVDVISSNQDSKLLMAGGRKGVYRTGDGDENRYVCCSREEFSEEVTLPKTWLFCSGEHNLMVVGEDETR